MLVEIEGLLQPAQLNKIDQILTKANFVNIWSILFSTTRS